jgi:hypothetical protein
MANYKPRVDNVLPSLGESKILYSPDLFDVTTGTYRTLAVGQSAAYPLDAEGKFQFYLGSTLANKSIMFAFAYNSLSSTILDPANAYDSEGVLIAPADSEEASHFSTYAQISFSSSGAYRTQTAPTSHSLQTDKYSFTGGTVTNPRIKVVLDGNLMAAYVNNIETRGRYGQINLATNYVTSAQLILRYSVDNGTTWTKLGGYNVGDKYTPIGTDNGSDYYVEIPKQTLASSILSGSFSLDNILVQIESFSEGITVYTWDEATNRYLEMFDLNSNVDAKIYAIYIEYDSVVPDPITITYPKGQVLSFTPSAGWTGTYSTSITLAVKNPVGTSWSIQSSTGPAHYQVGVSGSTLNVSWNSIDGSTNYTTPVIVNLICSDSYGQTATTSVTFQLNEDTSGTCDGDISFVVPDCNGTSTQKAQCPAHISEGVVTLCNGISSIQ